MFFHSSPNCFTALCCTTQTETASPWLVRAQAEYKNITERKKVTQLGTGLGLSLHYSGFSRTSAIIQLLKTT